MWEPIILVNSSPKMDFSTCVCKMLVDVTVFCAVMKMVLRPIPNWYLNRTSKRIPAINVIEPMIMEIFRNLSESIFKSLNNCVEIKKRPINPKNSISFPLDDPIKNKYVIGCIIGFKISVMKSTPAIIINRIPTNIVLFIFIKNNYLN